jgi:tetratricopeptide (TPR) repeat protein
VATSVFEVSPPRETQSPVRASPANSATTAAAVRARFFQRASAAAAAAQAAAVTSSSSGQAEEDGVESRKIVKARRFSEDAAQSESDWQLFKQSGEDLLEAGSTQEAITFFTQAIMCRPADDHLGHLFLARAKAYQTIGLVTKSRFDCIRAAELLEPKKKVESSRSAAKEEAAAGPVVREVTVESLAKLQIRLAPLLASIEALREWVSEDAGRFRDELEPALIQLQSAELLAKTALSGWQRQLVEKVIAEDEADANKK